MIRLGQLIKEEIAVVIVDNFVRGISWLQPFPNQLDWTALCNAKKACAYFLKKVPGSSAVNFIRSNLAMLTLQEREAIARSPAWKLSLSPVESQDAFSSGKASGQCFISNSAMSKLASPPLRCTGPWSLCCQIRSRSSKASSWAISPGTPVSFFCRTNL